MKNEKNKVTCECAATGCGWRVHASLMANNITFQIKTLREDHSCTMLFKNPMVTCEWLSRKIEDKVRCNHGMKIKDLKNKVGMMIGVHVSNAKLYRAKNRVLERLGRDHGVSYSKLHDYRNILLCKNPDTMVQVKCHRNYISENPVFQEFFFCFLAQKDGFLKGCRPFNGVDGCHLKGQFGGVLLTAIGVDANNSIFPLAFSVCEGENYDTWIWFLNLISEYIGVHETRRICFMSDRRKGLLKATNEVFPNAFNRYCARHIFANFKSHFPGVKVSNLFWAASRSTNIKDFNVAMEGIKVVDLDAYTWLKDIPVDSWSKHAFGTNVKVDHVTNNLTESFNSQIDSIRNKPILQLVESLRRKVMKKFSKREQKAKDWLTDLPPSIQAKVNKFQRENRPIQVIHARNSEFEVLHESVIGKTHPIPDESSWPQMEGDKVHPPANKRKPGRPKLARRMESDELVSHKRSYVLKCGVCKAMGLNKGTCPKVPLHAKKKKKSYGTARGEGSLINAQGTSSSQHQGSSSQPIVTQVLWFSQP
nr:uncharacterized protein LOC112493082 [Ziziphus jujuba var. spinosa]